MLHVQRELYLSVQAVLPVTFLLRLVCNVGALS